MGNMLIAAVSPVYRTENDKELCRELDALEEPRQDGEALHSEDRVPLRDQTCGQSP